MNSYQQHSLMAQQVAAQQQSLVAQQSWAQPVHQAGLAALQNLGRSQLPVATAYMIAGQAMTREEFIQAVYPENTPERTWFLLRFPAGT